MRVYPLGVVRGVQGPGGPWTPVSGEGGLLCRGQHPPPALLTIKGKSFYILLGEGGDFMQKTHSQLEIGHWWSEQHHVGCFKYS